MTDTKGVAIMRKSREELGRIHKEKCKELKQVRAKIAEDLGVDLHQTECTYEGYCSGTCPKCKSEEWKLNMAIMKRQMEEADVKRRVTAAGLTTMAALSLAGCNVVDPMTVDGAIEEPYAVEQLEGDVAWTGDPTQESTAESSVESTEATTEQEFAGEIPFVSEEDWIGGEQAAEESSEEPTDLIYRVLEGDIAYTEESNWEIEGGLLLAPQNDEAGEE